jgi:hypothetical protein
MCINVCLYIYICLCMYGCMYACTYVCILVLWLRQQPLFPHTAWPICLVNICSMFYKNTCLFLQGISEAICHNSGERPYVKLDWYIQKFLYLNMNAYACNNGRKIRSCCGSTRLAHCATHTPCGFILEPISIPRHMEAKAPCKVLGNLRTIFMKRGWAFLI